MVSVTVSFPFRGAFHLSLTVLVHYRSERMFRLGTLDVLDSHRVSCPVILGYRIVRFQISDTRLSLSMVNFSKLFSYLQSMTRFQPHNTTRHQISDTRFRYLDLTSDVRNLTSGSLAFSLFARRYWGNHYYFLFLSLLRCFSSGGCLCYPILPYGIFR